MKKRSMNDEIERRVTGFSKNDVIKLDTKCLYVGKLERIKRWTAKKHSHPFCEIVYVFSGGGETEVNGVVYPLKKGDIAVYNAYAEHRETTNSAAGIELGYFGITNFQVSDLPADALIGKQATPVLHTQGLSERFAFYFRSLLDEMTGEVPYGELMAKYWARLILIEILRLANISEAKFVTNALFTRIHEYLSTNFAKIESIDQICKDLNISKYYLSHVFKNYMGMPPIQYVTTRRIAYAKRLLQETDLTATAIGEACGYKDHVLFFKAFKKLEGVTPLTYRKNAESPPVVEKGEENK